MHPSSGRRCEVRLHETSWHRDSRGPRAGPVYRPSGGAGRIRCDAISPTRLRRRESTIATTPWRRASETAATQPGTRMRTIRGALIGVMKPAAAECKFSWSEAGHIAAHPASRRLCSTTTAASRTASSVAPLMRRGHSSVPGPPGSSCRETPKRCCTPAKKASPRAPKA